MISKAGWTYKRCSTRRTKPSLLQKSNILKRQLFRAFLNVSYYRNSKITCHRLRSEKGGTAVISCSETRPFLLHLVKRLRKAGIYKKLFRVITVPPVLFKEGRLRDILNAATHAFSLTHHKMRNLSASVSVHLKQKE